MLGTLAFSTRLRFEASGGAVAAPAGVGYAVMNVSTGVNNAGRSRPVAVKLPISADCLPTGTPPMLNIVDELLEAPVLGLPRA